MGDPLSPILVCISTIGKITSYIQHCRDARHDLDNISHELMFLRDILSLLKDDTTTNGQAIPETLRKDIATIITNCSTVLEEFDELLQRCNGSVSQAVWWATRGISESAKLLSSLEQYRKNLIIALGLLTQLRMGEILAKLDRLSGPLQAGESRTHSEDRNDGDIENDHRISKRYSTLVIPSMMVLIKTSLIPSCDSDRLSLSQQPVQDTPSPFPPDIHGGGQGNSRTGRRRSIFSRRSNPYPISLKGHRGWVLDITFSPDGKLVASASLDNTVKLWDVATGKGHMTFRGHSSCVRAVAFSPPDGKLIASASLDNTVRLWDVATGRNDKRFEAHKSSVQAVAFSPDGKIVASSSNDLTIKLWDPGTCGERGTFKGHTDSIWAVAFSPDGKLVASASLDKSVRLWDPATGQGCRKFEDHSKEVRAVAFSPGGKLIASASHDCTVKLWDPATGRVCRTFRGHKGDVHAVAFSPDGRLVASASLDNTVKLWDVATGRHGGMLVGHRNSVQAVAFSPDGKIVASSSNDGTIRLWDPAMAEM
ncbi:MAG: hypothetical protein M1813_002855 [Trichoglossum hirsutum]|nr:MAG: hypothetical protein M1813_002855 [Trichoglossum hirsutum]